MTQCTYNYNVILFFLQLIGSILPEIFVKRKATTDQSRNASYHRKGYANALGPRI